MARKSIFWTVYLKMCRDKFFRLQVCKKIPNCNNQVLFLILLPDGIRRILHNTTLINKKIQLNILKTGKTCILWLNRASNLVSAENLCFHAFVKVTASNTMVQLSSLRQVLRNEDVRCECAMYYYPNFMRAIQWGWEKCKGGYLKPIQMRKQPSSDNLLLIIFAHEWKTVAKLVDLNKFDFFTRTCTSCLGGNCCNGHLLHKSINENHPDKNLSF